MNKRAPRWRGRPCGSSKMQEAGAPCTSGGSSMQNFPHPPATGKMHGHGRHYEPGKWLHKWLSYNSTGDKELCLGDRFRKWIAVQSGYDSVLVTTAFTGYEYSSSVEYRLWMSETTRQKWLWQIMSIRRDATAPCIEDRLVQLISILDERGCSYLWWCRWALWWLQMSTRREAQAPCIEDQRSKLVSVRDES